MRSCCFRTRTQSLIRVPAHAVTPASTPQVQRGREQQAGRAGAGAVGRQSGGLTCTLWALGQPVVSQGSALPSAAAGGRQGGWERGAPAAPTPGSSSCSGSTQRPAATAAGLTAQFARSAPAVEAQQGTAPTTTSAYPPPRRLQAASAVAAAVTTGCRLCRHSSRRSLKRRVAGGTQGRRCPQCTPQRSSANGRCEAGAQVQVLRQGTVSCRARWCQRVLRTVHCLCSSTQQARVQSLADRQWAAPRQQHQCRAVWADMHHAGRCCHGCTQWLLVPPQLSALATRLPQVYARYLTLYDRRVKLAPLDSEHKHHVRACC